MTYSIRARAVVRLAELLCCRRELLEVISEGTLRFVGPSLPVPYADLGATEFERLFPVTGRHIPDPQKAGESPNRLPQNAHTAAAFSFPPRFFKGSYLKVRKESNRAAIRRRLMEGT